MKPLEKQMKELKDSIQDTKELDVRPDAVVSKHLASCDARTSIQHLRDIGDNVGFLLESIQPENDLESWVIFKITRALTDIQDVAQYLKNNDEAHDNHNLNREDL